MASNMTDISQYRHFNDLLYICCLTKIVQQTVRKANDHLNHLTNTAIEMLYNLMIRFIADAFDHIIVQYFVKANSSAICHVELFIHSSGDFIDSIRFGWKLTGKWVHSRNKAEYLDHHIVCEFELSRQLENQFDCIHVFWIMQSSNYFRSVCHFRTYTIPNWKWKIRWPIYLCHSIITLSLIEMLILIFIIENAQQQILFRFESVFRVIKSLKAYFSFCLLDFFISLSFINYVENAT